MNKIRLTSLTDVDVPEVREGGLLGQTIVIHRYVLGPGEEVIADEDDTLLRHAAEFVQKHALAVGGVPPWYRVAKDNMPKAKAK